MSEEHVLDWDEAVRYREEHAATLEVTVEACIGTEGVAETNFGPQGVGRVDVLHRIWEAENEGEGPIAVGEPIQVLGYRGEYLVVQKRR